MLKVKRVETTWYLRGIEESLTVTGMDSFSRTVPASVISISGVRACVDYWILDFLNLLITQTFLNFKQLLRGRVFSRVSNSANGAVPCGPLGSQQVFINLMLHLGDSCLGFLMVWICVFIPTIETSLVARIVQLTVMD